MTARVYSCTYSSPVGPIEIVETDGALSQVRLLGSSVGNDSPSHVESTKASSTMASSTMARSTMARSTMAGSTMAGSASTPLLRRAQKQLSEYFAGRRRAFDLPLAPHGTPFQRSVWNELATIPFGATSTYGSIARAVGQPQAARAVGGAIGANPLALVIPCHRVLAGDRRLTGFSGGEGVPTKVALLTLEGCEFRP